MQCPKCQFENPADSLFCGECGSALLVTCPNCGATPPASFKFCNKCGQRLGKISKSNKTVVPLRSEGKTEPDQICRGQSSKERPVILEYLSGVKADLVNRKTEIAEPEAAKEESILKAVNDLMKSGEKSLRGYAIEESHQLYKEAFDLLSNKPAKNIEELELLIELLINWGYVFYYRGDFRSQIETFSSHLDLAESIDDKSKRGMFNAWLGLAHDMSGSGDIAQLYLKKALDLGEECGDQVVIGYACAWLAWSCIYLGMMEDAMSYGERAHEISKQIESDHYLHFKSLGAFNLAYRFLGEVKKANEIGNQLVEYGQKNSNIRNMTLGHIGIGLSHLTAGDFSSASESLKRAIEIAIDPVYSVYAKTYLINVQLVQADYNEAEKTINEVLSFWWKYGYGICGLYAYGALGMLSVARGQTNRGLKILQEAISDASRQGHKNFNMAFEQMLGNAYRQISQGDSPESMKAEEHLNKAVELALEIGAKGLLGPIYLDIGLLYRSEKRPDKVHKYISKAIQVFKECGANGWLDKCGMLY